MGYGSVGAPTFYINMPEFYNSRGIDPIYHDDIYSSADLSMIRKILSPTVNKILLSEDIFFNDILGNVATDSSGTFTHSPFTGSTKNYIAIFDHSLKTSNVYLEPYSHDAGSFGSVMAFSDVVNYGAGAPEFDGFSLTRFTSTTYNGINKSSGSVNMGSIMTGNYYTMPQNADLNLSINYEMDGIKKIRTKSGNDLLNYNYVQSSIHYEDGTMANLYRLGKSGRRSWDLEFSYMSAENLLPATGSFEYYSTFYDDYSTAWTTNENTLFLGDNFFSQVMHRTNGGQIPFLFQPDSTNDNIDQFALCTIDGSSIEFKQVAPQVYNISLKIRETW
tara:strand:- start:12085 stop:13080 length:996 start_codon:yes stop_codon:yes gene_type:complete